jgi:hypothetical protein
MEAESRRVMGYRSPLPGEDLAGSKAGHAVLVRRMKSFFSRLFGLAAVLRSGAHSLFPTLVRSLPCPFGAAARPRRRTTPTCKKSSASLKTPSRPTYSRRAMIVSPSTLCYHALRDIERVRSL